MNPIQNESSLDQCSCRCMDVMNATITFTIGTIAALAIVLPFIPKIENVLKKKKIFIQIVIPIICALALIADISFLLICRCNAGKKKIQDTVNRGIMEERNGPNFHVGDDAHEICDDVMTRIQEIGTSLVRIQTYCNSEHAEKNEYIRRFVVYGERLMEYERKEAGVMKSLKGSYEF